ncbi:aladin-like isoform X2 [Adelges cooleyi]|uniref:aladin-like isoform X2 n=1 Tax=Adelges cooleyi TaxID=133065 RepID=UPI0021800D4F|nr:aladin-like isoform X2 [Adelges cooleyi]
MFQSLISKCMNEGFWVALDEVDKYINRNSNNLSAITYPIKCIIKCLSPRTNLKGPESVVLSDISRTKLWSSSMIRCMAWHPQTIKLAIASSHDYVFIYNKKGVEAKIKKKSQRAILSLAWRPLSTGTLAVGCERGIFIWNIEFSLLHARPTISNVCDFVRDDHRYITGLSWNKMGDLLISTALNSKTMYIWNYPLETCVPLRRIGSDTLNFIQWSPDNTKLFSCTSNESFRIWTTDKWSSDKWSVNSKSRVQCACWSPCSSVLLFATNSCATINAIDFRKSDIFNEPSNYKKVAWPVIDLKNERINDKDIGGIPSDMCWDQNGKRLAVTFKDSSAVLVFTTIISASAVECTPLCIIQGRLDEEPSAIAFQPVYNEGSLLTIGWSNGNIEYIPFSYNTKPRYEPEINETSLFQLKPHKNVSGRANITAASPSV